MSSPVGGGNGNSNGSIDGGRHGKGGDVEFGDSLSPQGHGHGHGHGLGVGKKDGGKRKSILVRNRNPVGRLFDGVVEDDAEGEEEEVDEKAGKWNTLTTPMFHDFANVTSLEDPFIANLPLRLSQRPRRP